MNRARKVGYSRATNKTPAGEGLRHDLRQHPAHDRPHAHREDQSSRAVARDDVREVRVLQSARLGQGPARDRHHRGCREARRPEARPDRRRGDLGQHRHRARDGLRREGLSVRGDDGRDLLGRAPQDHAHARREGDPDACRRTRQRHGAQGRGTREEARLVPRAPVRERGEPRLSPADDRPGNPRAISRAGGSTSSSRAGARAAR